jgi:hypothetical protein
MCGGCHRGLDRRPVGVITPVHEGGAHASLAARRALLPRQGESPADAKWPLSMEGAPGRRSHVGSRRRGGSGLGSSRPGGPTRRRGHRPPKTGAGDATGASEVGGIGRAGKNTPCTVKESPGRGGCGSPKRGIGSRDDPPSPATRRVPKPVASTRRASAGDAPGASEYGYT